MKFTRLQPLLLCILISVFQAVVHASRGDRLEVFQRCVSDHIDRHCQVDDPDLTKGSPLPLHLRALSWTCVSDGDYLCQQAVTQHLEDIGAPVEQFHGKWPFIRVLGVQEPASVLFSIMNGYVHFEGLRQVQQRISPRSPMRQYYILFALIGMNTWLWSSVFHMRDFPATEKLDYFSAGSYVLYGFFYAPIRVFRLYHHRSYKTLVYIWASLCTIAFVSHISYLTFGTFDYGYNMLANVVIGALHGLFWLLYSFLYSADRPGWVWWPVFTVIALAGAMSLELFDFSPFFYVVDAHSLWHLATVPITWFWYCFLIKDAEWENHDSTNEPKRKS